MSKKCAPMSNHTSSKVASGAKPAGNSPHPARVANEAKLVNSIMKQSVFKR